MAAKKTVPVTSVTPAIKTTPVPAAQQKRTRDLVMGIATAVPAIRTAAGIKGAGGKMVSALYKDLDAEAKNAARHSIRIEQEKIMAKAYKEHLKQMEKEKPTAKQLSEHYKSLTQQWNN
jgi:fructose-1,6-bisphosphatase/sedoheptulose 1,7-bisphosphatase-like protein